MDIVTSLMSNKIALIVIAIVVAFIVFKIIKKVISAIITGVLIIALFMGCSTYLDGITDKFSVSLNDGILNVKVMEKTYDIDIDYIDRVEVTSKEDSRQLVIKSKKEGTKDITLEVPDMAYLIVVKPTIKKLDIELVNK